MRQPYTRRQSTLWCRFGGSLASKAVIKVELGTTCCTARARVALLGGGGQRSRH